MGTGEVKVSSSLEVGGGDRWKNLQRLLGGLGLRGWEEQSNRKTSSVSDFRDKQSPKQQSGLEAQCPGRGRA